VFRSANIGVYGGAFKVTEGFVGHFGEERVIDTPGQNRRSWDGLRCRYDGMRPVAEMQFIDFISAASTS
jgi:2-oxoisovalerate dehydrogenase E1 component beta subunit